jgi:hypothetical protein
MDIGPGATFRHIRAGPKPAPATTGTAIHRAASGAGSSHPHCPRKQVRDMRRNQLRGLISGN